MFPEPPRQIRTIKIDFDAIGDAAIFAHQMRGNAFSWLVRKEIGKVSGGNN
jgi:hypothetical protein